MTIGRYPMMNPPVGPANTPIPPCIPAKTGMPITPRDIYTAVLITPSLAGSKKAVSNSPKNAKFIGTGAVGMVIIEQMHSTAENKAHLHRFLILLFID